MRPLVLLILTIVMGCASDHDLKRDGPNLFGGGFIEDEIKPGLYLIKAFSNTSPFSTLDSAKRTFMKRADALCGKDSYTIVNSNLDSYDSSFPLSPPPKISFMAGHVLCSSSRITLEEAKKIVSVE
ncbi:MAG: hypothetical protein L6Q40_10735 [Azonexus sp.]|nr:hypothetical protein [Azonexus sp.]